MKPRRSTMTNNPSESEHAQQAGRAEEIFEEHYNAHLKRTDRLFAWLMVGQWIFGILIALVYSPSGWVAKTRSVHVHVPIAIVLGGLLSALPLVLILRRPGEPITRYTIAVSQMLWSALLIHLTGGRIETHFHV